MTSPQFFLCVPYSFQSLNPTSIQRGPPDGRVTRADIAYVRRISQDVPRPFPLAEKKKGDREEKQSYGQLKVEGEERKNLGRSREENPPPFLPSSRPCFDDSRKTEGGGEGGADQERPPRGWNSPKRATVKGDTESEDFVHLGDCTTFFVGMRALDPFPLQPRNAARIAPEKGQTKEEEALASCPCVNFVPRDKKVARD